MKEFAILINDFIQSSIFTSSARFPLYEIISVFGLRFTFRVI